MKTISFRIKTSEELKKVISEDSRLYSSIYRFAYNRFKEGLSGKEVYAKASETFENVNCHIRNSAQRNAVGLYHLNKDKKVYFGKFKRFQRGLITKEEYKDSKNVGILSGKEVYAKASETFENVNCHIRNSAQRNAVGLYHLNKDKKVYFGKFKRFQRGLITKEEYKDSKNVGILSEGEFN